MRSPVKARRRPVRPVRSASEQHRQWLQLVETDGPFLSIPVLKRVYPQGITPLGGGVLGELKEAKTPFEKAWDAFDREGEPQLDAYRAARDAWAEVVLRRVFGWGPHYVTDALTVVRSPNGRVTATSTGAFRRGEATAALTWVIDPVRSLHDLLDDGWATSPIDRMELMLRAAGVPIGVVTDGRWWAIVSAPRKTMVASGVVDSQTWVEESDTRDAFAALLSPLRLAGGAEADRLPAMFRDSVAAAEEITESLGSQVRRAIELLVQSFSESAEEAGRRGDPDPLPTDGDRIYAAAVTVMMRVVFLLFAEERDLLPQGQLFAQGYGLTGQLEELRRRAEAETPESLDATSAVWHRLLATSRALFHGATFEDMRLPAYGGSLFDPTRFPFLSSRTDRGTLALAVNDRVMMHVLDAVQMAEIKGQGRRPISFRDIDVEQIGYIYEGLLGYTCAFATETIIGLIGKTGSEPEIPLAVLNDLADQHVDDKPIAAAILAWVKEHQPGAVPPSASALAKALANDQLEDADLAIRAVTHDEDLAAELGTWIGVIRRDLRHRPTVIKQGGLVVVETPSRKNAGAHYTPRSLAEEVVLHALEPLVYAPGPYQTPHREEWRLKSPEEILDLKVADIACGSGAFLVAAARYLAARLVEAWAATGTGIGTPKQQATDALRKVVAQCLYGADINPMAIEMCKLSLWLVSLDPKQPFSFVDDKMLVGNSLLGITDLAQIRALHINGKVTHTGTLFDIDTDGPIQRAIRIRRALASTIDNDDPQRSARRKQQQLDDLHAVTGELRTWADAVVAAGLRLGGKPGKALDAAYANLKVAVEQAQSTGDHTMLDDIIRLGLTPTVETDYQRWRPLHWPLELPDVFERSQGSPKGGFDAVIGNPPFLGGTKLKAAIGPKVRDWYSYQVAGRSAGKTDMVAYFFLRAHGLLSSSGSLGLIGTNTVAQGDTREVGLDQMVADGFTITRADQSRQWSASGAALQFSAVWGTSGRVASTAPRVANGRPARTISTLLEEEGTRGLPVRLSENAGISFGGCKIYGQGFILDPDEVVAWIEQDKRYSHVLAPYLNGEDVTSRPDLSAPRWVIDFNDLSEESAASYLLPYARALDRVKPERQRTNSSGRHVLRNPLPERWWQYADRRPGLRLATSNLDSVLVIAVVSKTVMPVRVPTGQIFSHRLAVFATDSYSVQAMLSSSPHWLWAVTYSSTLESRVAYSPADCYLTFPHPLVTHAQEVLGRTLETERREIMLRRDLGLTKLYNLVNDPAVASVSDPDVARMREIHVELDEAVMAAYGWDDVPLNHGFHTYRQMERWTVCPEARVEILDRLLEENHRRAALQGNVLTRTDAGED